MADLILDVLIAELKLHDVLKGSEEGFIEVKVWQLRPTAQDFYQNIMNERHSLLRYVTLLVTGRLWKSHKKLNDYFWWYACVLYMLKRSIWDCVQRNV